MALPKKDLDVSTTESWFCAWLQSSKFIGESSVVKRGQTKLSTDLSWLVTGLWVSCCLWTLQLAVYRSPSYPRQRVKHFSIMTDVDECISSTCRISLPHPGFKFGFLSGCFRFPAGSAHAKLLRVIHNPKQQQALQRRLDSSRRLRGGGGRGSDLWISCGLSGNKVLRWMTAVAEGNITRVTPDFKSSECGDRSLWLGLTWPDMLDAEASDLCLQKMTSSHHRRKPSLRKAPTSTSAAPRTGGSVGPELVQISLRKHYIDEYSLFLLQTQPSKEYAFCT